MKTYQEWQPILANVDGLMASESQREFMFNLGKAVRTGIELGTFRGLSACLVAAGMRAAGTAGKIWCVDTFAMTGFDSFMDLSDMRDTLGDFQLNAGKCGVSGICVPLRMATEDSPAWFRGNGVMADYLYVDAHHGEEETRRNCIGHLPFIRTGGLVMFHDYDLRPEYFPEVRAAVDALVADGHVEKVSQFDDFFVARKP